MVTAFVAAAAGIRDLAGRFLRVAAVWVATELTPVAGRYGGQDEKQGFQSFGVVGAGWDGSFGVCGAAHAGSERRRARQPDARGRRSQLDVGVARRRVVQARFVR